MNENLNPEVRDAADDIDDVEGHKRPVLFADGEETDDVEGHKRPLFGAEADETDDVSGHVQPRRDLDIER